MFSKLFIPLQRGIKQSLKTFKITYYDEKESLRLFEKKNVRTVWDDEEEKWYFSIVDVVGVLTDSPNPRNYWKVLKRRLLAEGNETVTNCNQLKLMAEDGKRRMTDVADVQQLMRLI